MHNESMKVVRVNSNSKQQTGGWLAKVYILLLLFTEYVIVVNVIAQQQLKVGILLSAGRDEEEAMFRWSIDKINDKRMLPDLQLQALVKYYSTGNIWDAGLRTCELIADGAVTIVGPLNGQVAGHVGFVCDAIDIPHLVVTNGAIAYLQQSRKQERQPMSAARRFDPSFEGLSTVSVDLGFSRHIILTALFDLIQVLNTNEFVYLYEDDDSVYNFQEHFNGEPTLKIDNQPNLNVRVHRFPSRFNYRSTFWAMKRANFRHFILDVRCDNLIEVLRQAQQVSMMTDKHSYLLTCPDFQTFNFEDFRYSKVRVLWFRLIDPSSKVLQELRHRLQSSDIKQYYAQHLSIRKLKTETALIHDALEAFAHTLSQYSANSNNNNGTDSLEDSLANLNDNPLSCENLSRTWIGSSLVNYLRSSTHIKGFTGDVSFLQLGERAAIKLHLMRLTYHGPRRVGYWEPRSNMQQSTSSRTQGYKAPTVTESGAINSTRKTNRGFLHINSSELAYIKKNDIDLEPKHILIVTSIKSEPFFMNKPTTKIETGNNRYEGFAIDLIQELSRIVGFDYIFKEVDDKNYGKQDEVTKQWNGMVREVMTGKADLAIGDLSITSSREDAVDFTLPFMNTGISILFKKPTTKELELFSFLSPFEGHVWIYVGGAYIGVSFFLFFIGRVSPYEWENPHPCRQEDKILRNQFSVANSFWFTIAALMQQGSDIAPRSLSTRLISACWYFFTIIMISSYTANLAAFLTVEKVVYPIEKAEDLYQHPQNIQYGCVESGSTATFFKNSKPESTFYKMYSEMVFARGNEEGTEKVEQGNYAFFMESVAIKYKIERRCNLTQIGNLLDSKGYGIALAKNSTRKVDYRTKLSEAILLLQESGTLEVLKTRWWKEKHGGGACDIDDNQSGDSVKELTLENVGGVFVVLLMGVCGSLTLCALELYQRCRRESKASGLCKVELMKRRLKFALALSENY